MIFFVLSVIFTPFVTLFVACQVYDYWRLWKYRRNFARLQARRVNNFPSNRPIQVDQTEASNRPIRFDQINGADLQTPLSRGFTTGISNKQTTPALRTGVYSTPPQFNSFLHQRPQLEQHPTPALTGDAFAANIERQNRLAFCRPTSWRPNYTPLSERASFVKENSPTETWQAKRMAKQAAKREELLRTTPKNDDQKVIPQKEKDQAKKEEITTTSKQKRKHEEQVTGDDEKKSSVVEEKVQPEAKKSRSVKENMKKNQQSKVKSLGKNESVKKTEELEFYVVLDSTELDAMKKYVEFRNKRRYECVDLGADDDDADTADDTEKEGNCPKKRKTGLEKKDVTSVAATNEDFEYYLRYCREKKIKYLVTETWEAYLANKDEWLEHLKETKIRQQSSRPKNSFLDYYRPVANGDLIDKNTFSKMSKLRTSILPEEEPLASTSTLQKKESERETEKSANQSDEKSVFTLRVPSIAEQSTTPVSTPFQFSIVPSAPIETDQLNLLKPEEKAKKRKEKSPFVSDDQNSDGNVNVNKFSFAPLPPASEMMGMAAKRIEGESEKDISFKLLLPPTTTNLGDQAKSLFQPSTSTEVGFNFKSSNETAFKPTNSETPTISKAFFVTPSSQKRSLEENESSSIGNEAGTIKKSAFSTNLSMSVPAPVPSPLDTAAAIKPAFSFQSSTAPAASGLLFGAPLSQKSTATTGFNLGGTSVIGAPTNLFGQASGSEATKSGAAGLPSTTGETNSVIGKSTTTTSFSSFAQTKSDMDGKAAQLFGSIQPLQHSGQAATVEEPKPTFSFGQPQGTAGFGQTAPSFNFGAQQPHLGPTATQPGFNFASTATPPSIAPGNSAQGMFAFAPTSSSSNEVRRIRQVKRSLRK